MRVAPLSACLALWACSASAEQLFPWLEAEVRKPHPIAWSVRKTAGPLVLIATPALMWTVAEKFGDKAGHCFAGAGASLSIGLMMQPKWGFVASVVIGAAKEGYDANQPDNHFDAADFAWSTGCGVIPALWMEMQRYDGARSVSLPVSLQ